MAITDDPSTGFSASGWTEAGWDAPEPAEIPDLTDTEIALRRMFVKEYYVDHNWTNAAIRCGFLRENAEIYARRFRNEPFVQNLMKEHLKTLTLDNEEYAAELERNVINTLARESNNFGAGATAVSRINAATNLGKLMNMEPDKNVNLNQQVSGGVMMVPAIADVTDWENVASESQQQLVTDTQDDDESTSSST